MQTTSYLYRPVLKRAYETAKRYSGLWIFGLFAVLVSAGGEYEIISRSIYNGDAQGVIGSFLTSFQGGWQEGLKLADGNFWSNFLQLLATNPAAVATTFFVLLLIIVLTLFVMWLSVASQIALIRGCSLAGKNKRLAAGEGLNYANKNFWPVFSIVVLLKVALFILFGLLGWEMSLLVGSGTIGTIVYIASFVVFTSAVLVISFILKYQTFYVLLKRQKLLSALKSAWQLFRDNWLISSEMALIMFGIYLVAAALSAFIMTFFAGIPLVIIPYYFTVMPWILKVIITILSAAFIIIGILSITAWMTVFQWAGWTALFEKLAGADDNVSKLERIGQELKELPNVILGRQ